MDFLTVTPNNYVSCARAMWTTTEARGNLRTCKVYNNKINTSSLMNCELL